MHKINLLASESDMCYRKSLCYMCHVMYISRMAIPAVSSWELFCLTLRFVTVMLELNAFLWCLWAVTLSFWDLIIWVLRKLIWRCIVMSLVISTPYLLVVQPLATLLLPLPALEPGTICLQSAFLPVFPCFQATLEASPISTVLSMQWFRHHIYRAFVFACICCLRLFTFVIFTLRYITVSILTSTCSLVVLLNIGSLKLQL